MTKDRHYNITSNTYYASTKVPVEDMCNGFTVTNTGATIVQVNDILLYPGTIGTNLGDSISIGGNENEIYKGVIVLKFNLPLVNPAVLIVQKFYMEKPK